MDNDFNFKGLIESLQHNNIVLKIISIFVDEISSRGLYKVRCQLIPTIYKLEIKIIKTPQYILYSYQLFTNKPILRWDNTPHYPKIRTFPHHFHDSYNKVRSSRLTRNVLMDLEIVMQAIQKFLTDTI